MGKQHTTPAVPAVDLYAQITSRILADLEQGVRPWVTPWTTGAGNGRVTRPLRATGEPYTGINVLLLWMEAVTAGHQSPTWMTYKQAQALGGQVKRGEKGSPIVYYGTTTARQDRAESAGAGDDAREVRFLKTYTVFNVAQIEGLPERFRPEPVEEAPALPAFDRLAEVDGWFEAIGATVAHGGAEAFYMPGEDRIQLPPPEAFRDAHGYYTTRAHETVHWTRHPSRLDRRFGRERWGDEGYAREELVAELGAAFLAADLGLALEPCADHADYLAHWTNVLQNDKRAIVSAAAHAERAVIYLHAITGAERGETA